MSRLRACVVGAGLCGPNLKHAFGGRRPKHRGCPNNNKDGNRTHTRTHGSTHTHNSLCASNEIPANTMDQNYEVKLLVNAVQKFL